MKLFGFWQKRKKCSDKFFRNVLANGIIACVLVGLFFLTYAGGTLNAFSNVNDSPIYNGNVNSNKISLMVNVYWGNEYIDPMLEIFRQNNIKTTFFVGGTWAEQYPELLQAIYQDGHEIANHGYFHKDHATISYTRNRQEIANTHSLIKQLLGIEMTLFAPPSGSFSKSTLEIAKSLGYKTIMWTRDTIDWRDQDDEVIYQRAIKNASGGDFILMHPTQTTVEALPRIIQKLTQSGFQLTTVSENLSI
jgi:peptidoglycan/xylan/chitin deacetylase (PgdA/CDA1 family)